MPRYRSKKGCVNIRQLIEKCRITFRSVVIAYVATLLFWSAIKLSRSTLQVATLVGCDRARAARVRVAANLRTGLGEDKKSWRTSIAFMNM
jgi:hypothetical protein